MGLDQPVLASCSRDDLASRRPSLRRRWTILLPVRIRIPCIGQAWGGRRAAGPERKAESGEAEGHRPESCCGDRLVEALDLDLLGIRNDAVLLLIARHVALNKGQKGFRV